MPENLFHKLLGTDPDVLNPDLYQLLELDREDLSDDQIEAQYKAKMKRLQEVRSTKYKHFVEFLKGQLQTARRTLTDPKSRQRYDDEILVAAVAELKQMVQTFIQISGDLTELEVTEILARARQLNVAERHVQRLIDGQLAAFGYRRSAPSVEQIERARRILRSRESSRDDASISARESLLAELAQEARSQSGEGGGASSASGAGSASVASGVSAVPGGPRAKGAARPRLVWSGKGEEARCERVMPDGSRERPLVFLSMPVSNIGVLVQQVTTYVCGSLGLQVYRTGGDRWDQNLTRLKACDILIADFSGPDEHPVAPDPVVITHATIAKYTHDKPVLALTQEAPEKRLPGWQFVYYDAERITDTSGENFPSRLKRALRRNLR